MKPIILFIHHAYQPIGGAGDIVGFFATNYDAFVALTKHEGSEEIAETIDCQTGLLISYYRSNKEWKECGTCIMQQFDAHRTQSGN